MLLWPFAHRLFITGPVSHFFYQLMEALIPTTDPHCIIKRLLLDRLVFAPGFLLIFYFVMNLLEVRSSRRRVGVQIVGDGLLPFQFKGREDLEKKLKGSFWTALRMNWKVWTPFQFVNINFVPVQVRAGLRQGPPPRLRSSHVRSSFQFRVLFANMVALFWYAYLASVRR